MVRGILEEKKGQHIVVLDVRGLTSVTDVFVLVTGTSPPHLRVLGETLQKELKQRGCRCYRRSGTAESGWIVEDYVDVVVHVFSEEHRAYYALERLWSDAAVVVSSTDTEASPEPPAS